MRTLLALLLAVSPLHADWLTQRGFSAIVVNTASARDSATNIPSHSSTPAAPSAQRQPNGAWSPAASE